LSLPLLALPWALRDPWTRFLAATLLLGMVGLLTTSFWHPPHYAAPFVAPALLVGVRCARQARLFAPRGRAVGRRLAAALLPASAVFCLFQIAELARGRGPSWSDERAAVARRLRQAPGDDLVLVRFAPWAPDYGWVYNGADRERSPIVWARQMTAVEDCALAAHYAGRAVWDLEVVDGVSPPRLERYARCEDDSGVAAPAALSRRGP
jgi:hypothetical protein